MFRFCFFLIVFDDLLIEIVIQCIANKGIRQAEDTDKNTNSMIRSKGCLFFASFHSPQLSIRSSFDTKPYIFLSSRHLLSSIKRHPKPIYKVTPSPPVAGNVPFCLFGTFSGVKPIHSPPHKIVHLL